MFLLLQMYNCYQWRRNYNQACQQCTHTTVFQFASSHMSMAYHKILVVYTHIHPLQLHTTKQTTKRKKKNVICKKTSIYQPKKRFSKIEKYSIRLLKLKIIKLMKHFQKKYIIEVLSSKRKRKEFKKKKIKNKKKQKTKDHPQKFKLKLCHLKLSNILN